MGVRRGPTRRIKRLAIIAAVVLGWTGSGAMVWHASYSAFTATTVNDLNSLSAGSVALSDNDSSAVMFNATGLKPGDVVTKCILVTYSGTLTSNVKMYIASADTIGGTGLGSYLDMVVDQGTDSANTFPTCNTITSVTNIFTGNTLANFATNKNSYANGVGTWAPTGSGQTKTFRVIFTVQNNNSANGLTATTIKFTWEAQNT
jgi:hypothetical protein